MAAKSEGTSLETVQKQRRQCFFNNLKLLEFNESYMERKHKISFNKDMFSVPNKKGFEVITYYLFTKLNEAIGEEEYRILFPVVDKGHAQEFRKTCHSHLNKISQDDIGLPFPQIVPSIFLTPGGERFYELYLAFSTYVLLKFVKKDGIVKTNNYLPPLTPDNQKILPTVLQLRTNASMKRFVETQKAAVDGHQRLENRAKKLTVLLRSSKQKLKDLNILLQDKIKQMSNSSDVSIDDPKVRRDVIQDIVQKSKEQVEKCEKSWSYIRSVIMKEKEYWEIVRTELKAESTKKYVLNGKVHMLKLPMLNTTKCLNELERRKFNCVYKEGKLCLLSFIDVWLTCLDRYKRVFPKGQLPKLSHAEDPMKKSLDTLSINLNVMKSLSERIVLDFLPKMQQDVEKLQSSALSKLNESIKEMKHSEEVFIRKALQRTEQFNQLEIKTTESRFRLEKDTSSLDQTLQEAAPLKGQCIPIYKLVEKLFNEPKTEKIISDYQFATQMCDSQKLFTETAPFKNQDELFIKPKRENMMSDYQFAKQMCDSQKLFSETASFKDQSSLRYKQSLTSLPAEIVSSLEKSTVLDQNASSTASSAGVSLPTSLNLHSLNMLSPLREDTTKTDGNTFESLDDDEKYDLLLIGAPNLDSESFLDSSVFGNISAEEILSSTLPIVPLYDSDSFG